MDQSAFFTRSAHSESQKMPLYTPDGSATEHFLMIQGVYSDAFREKNTEVMRAAMSSDITQEDRENLRYELVSSLVTAWSFDQPCTIENVSRFLKEAPQIHDQISAFSSKSENFCEKK